MADPVDITGFEKGRVWVYSAAKDEIGSFALYWFVLFDACDFIVTLHARAIGLDGALATLFANAWKKMN